MGRNSHQLASALEKLEEIREEAAGREFAVFLDYDGTLTPIVERPELALLTAEMRAIVERLASQMKVAVISGRDLRDVQKMVAIDNIFYAGSHGFEIEGPGGWHLDSKQVMDFLPLLDRAEQDLRKRLASIEGALVERKRFSIAIHYRLAADEQVSRVTGAVAAVAEAFPKLRRTTGKKIYELQPQVDWHKGKAVKWLLDGLGLAAENVLPVFIGDDITDEDAFRALERDGVGIIVRDEERETAARFALETPAQVGEFLERLASGAPA